MAIGGNLRYPSLQSIADLFRSSINDDMSGATNTPGEGNIATNLSPFLLTFMNSAIRDVYSDLRNVGDAALILDNYIVFGIPALATQNAATQVSLGYNGYYNGSTIDSTRTLPISAHHIERIWERPVGGTAFVEMQAVPSGLAPMLQGGAMRYWEMRQNAVWMPGCTQAVDLRLRCRIYFPDVLNPQTVNFLTTYVPILDCANAVVAKMLRLYARRFAPDMYQMAVADEKSYMDKLQLEVVRQMQVAETFRAEFGSY